MAGWEHLFYNEVLPFSATFSVECATVGLNTLFKAASSKGMSNYVFVVYSYGISTLLLLPVPFIYCSKVGLPSLNFPIFVRICLLALVGFLAQIAGYKGIEYTSPTLSSALSNLTPAFTFFLAVLLRMEKLAFRSSSTQAKIIGTMASISGALVVVLYKGPVIWSTQSPPTTNFIKSPLGKPQSRWLIGGLLLATQYLLFAVWYILQTQIMRMFPMELLVSFCYTLCVTIISAPVCFWAERDLDAWRLSSNIALVAIVYSGFLGPSYKTIVHAWCIRLKGPLYVVAFKPLSIAIAAFMGFMFLGDALTVGCVVGAAIICMGLYAVIWGKANEEISSEDKCLSISKTPLLQTLPFQDV